MTRPTSYQQFKDLFQSLYGELCNYAYSFLLDDAAAEDVVQETFIKLWEKHSEMIGIPNINAYLFRAVRNNSISALRKLNTTANASKAISYTLATETEPEAFAKEALTPYYEQFLYEAIASLPPQCREVFTCCKLKGMSQQQTATQLGLSVKTVENYMGRALKLLRKYLTTAGFPIVVVLIIKMLYF
jgi:RNA polymerase sigma-70 factor (family 1)